MVPDAKIRGDLSSSFDLVRFKNKPSHLKVIGSNRSRKEKDGPLNQRNGRDLEERRRLLLNELYKEGRCGEFSDERERFSVDKSTHLDEGAKSKIATKLLKRLSGRRKRRSSFNLEEDEENAGFDLDFTHKGVSLSSMGDNDIRNSFDFGDNEELFEDGHNGCKTKSRGDDVLDDEVMSGFFFGQGKDFDSFVGGEDSSKSRQEIFKEIMQKSKIARIEMKRHKEDLEKELLDLNDAFDDVQSLLTFKRPKKERLDSLVSNVLGNRDEDAKLRAGGTLEETEHKLKMEDENDDYELIRSQLRFDSRSGVSERIKTKEEIAKINSERLEKLERDRKERMNMSVNFEFGTDEEGEEEKESTTEEVELSEHEDSESEDTDEVEESFTGFYDEEPKEAGGLDACNEFKGVSLKIIEEFLNFDESVSINWLKNEDNEHNLPFSCNLKKILTNYNLNELVKFLGGFSPVSQWKFISRFRACFSSSDTGMLNDLKLLFGFLVKYPLKFIGFANEMALKDETGMNIFKFVIKYLKLMTGHLLFMVETDPKECLVIFAYFVLEICCTTFPGIRKSKRVERFLNEQLLDIESENYYTEMLEECQSLYLESDDAYEPTLEHILMCRMIFLIFPITDAQHPMLTPVIICLEQWAYRWSQIGKSFLNPTECQENKSEYNQIRLVNEPNLSCVVGLITLLEIASIGYCGREEGDHSDRLERFSIGYFSLSLSCLKYIITEGSNLNCKNISISIGILNSLVTVIERLKDTQGLYVILIHLVTPNINEIKKYSSDNADLIVKETSTESYEQLTSLISDILRTSLEILSKPLKPVNLCPRQRPTIRSLTPKLEDPSVPFAAKAMLKAKRKSKESQYDLERRLYLSRLKKEVNNARRQANRQIKRDSQVLASISQENKRLKTIKRDEKYNSFMKMLQDDQAEYKRMKTTGGTMDTSIESYRLNKKKKKENKRMGGNKTEAGMMH